MAVDWESHREVSKGLYLGDKKSLAEIMKHLAEHYGFNASKAQYEAQFKKWNWRKNLQKSEWEYISRKFGERKRQDAGKESAVFFHGSRIPSAKVKKEMSRHVHPNDQFYLRRTTKSRICDRLHSPGREHGTPPHLIASMTSAKRKHQSEELPQQHAVAKRQQTLTVAEEATLNDVPITDVVSTARCFRSGSSPESSIASTRIRIAPNAINLDGLPFFQFRKLMRSQDVVNGFEKMLTVNDTLVENLVANYWEQPSLLQHADSHILSLELDSAVYNSRTNDGFESLNAYLPMQNSPLTLCKPFGIELLDKPGSAEGWSVLEWSQKAQMDVSVLLVSMPRIPDDDLQQSMDLLLGPPTVESLRYVMEVGVYLSSNNVRHTDDFIQWMLRIVPWGVLRSILSIPVSTVQAFAESVLRVATSMGNVRVVKDLLQNPRLMSMIQSSRAILFRAVRSSNAELVRLFLHAGARADLNDYVPLAHAKTVEIARMLIEAGADVNALGKWTVLSVDGRVTHTVRCSALGAAVGNHDVTLARCLIGAGADVNRPTPRGTPLEMAAQGKQRALLELLLEHGAHVNGDWKHRDGNYRGALLCASISGSLDCVKLLVEAGADVNARARQRHQWTALQAASCQGHLEMVTFFLNHGANVNAPIDMDTCFPKTVLNTAVEKNHLELVELLLNAGADVNIPSFSYYGCTVLEAAKSRPASSEIVDILIANGARDPALPLDPHREIELRRAVFIGDLGRLQYLIDLGVQIDIQMVERDLHYGVQVNDDNTVIVEIFRLLIENVKVINAQNKAPGLSSLLVIAAARRNIEVVEMLIDAGADVNGFNARGETPLSTAAVDGNDEEMVRFLLGKGADINAIVEGSDFYNTALQASLFHGNEDISYLLLANGARLNAPIASWGSSELAYAVQTNSIRLVREVLDRGAEINLAPSDDRGYTALQAAARHSDMAMVQLLLENGADVNAPGRSTALQFVIERGHFRLTLLFLEAGADINAQARKRPGRTLYIETALEMAAYHGRLDILYLLLKAGADLHLPIEERYVSAASWARKQGHIVIAEILEGWDKGGGARDNREDWAQRSKEKERFLELD